MTTLFDRIGSRIDFECLTENTVKLLLQFVSAVGLAMTLIPSVLGFFGAIGMDAVKVLTVTGTVVWFATTPLWMGRELPIDADEVEI